MISVCHIHNEIMVQLHQWFIITLCLCFTAGQVLNGYINPLWTSDRRARARALYTSQQSVLPETSDYYLTRGGLYSDRPDFRRMNDLFYLDDMGRYQPVYREDRVFRTEPRTYFTSAAQQQEYVALTPSSQSLTPTAENES